MMTDASKPANDTAPAGPAPIMVWEIKSKDRTLHGRVYEGTVTKGHHAEIVPGKRIRLFGLVAAGSRWVQNAEGRNVPCEEHVYVTDFAIGDPAVYGSYNLVYVGKITAIGEKTVTIVEDDGRGRVHRLDLCEFDARNWDFDAEEIARRNGNWSD